ncbi:MAG: chitobiase/beta-hexosaminidase C-terminal domain-containing protein, partial [Bacillota bacterium]|nr:chitobiase/beta-hexosaminidase C-terminal domain-containing protein [Bacillota bacterium]
LYFESAKPVTDTTAVIEVVGNGFQNATDLSAQIYKIGSTWQFLGDFTVTVINETLLQVNLTESLTPGTYSIEFIQNREWLDKIYFEVTSEGIYILDFFNTQLPSGYTEAEDYQIKVHNVPENAVPTVVRVIPKAGYTVVLPESISLTATPDLNGTNYYTYDSLTDTYEVFLQLPTGLEDAMYQLELEVSAGDQLTDSFIFAEVNVGIPKISYIDPKTLPIGLDKFDFTVYGYNLNGNAESIDINIYDYETGEHIAVTDFIYSSSNSHIDVSAALLPEKTFINQRKYEINVSVGNNSAEYIMAANDAPVVLYRIFPQVQKAHVDLFQVRLEKQNISDSDTIVAELFEYSYEEGPGALVATGEKISSDSKFIYLGMEALELGGEGVPPGEYELRIKVNGGPDIEVGWIYFTEYEDLYSINSSPDVYPGKVVRLYGWNLFMGYTVEFYDLDGNIVAVLDNINGQKEWDNSFTYDKEFIEFAIPELPNGQYYMEVWSNNGYFLMDVGLNVDSALQPPAGSPYVNIVLPAETVAEDVNLSASFDVTIETDNIDWSQINLATDVEVWMEGKHIPVMWHATNVTGPDSSGRITATFEGIEVGEYAVIARVRDTFDWVPLFVDSFESKPVINRHANIRPAGYPFFGFNLDGYNLENLSNAVVELYDAANDQVVATTDGSEDWLGAFPSQEGTRLYVEMKAVDVDNGLQAGSYEVRIVDANWDAAVGNRVGPLTILDTPFIERIGPTRLGVGVTDYFLSLFGYFLNQLNSDNLVVELRELDGTVFATTDNVDIIIESTFNGRGQLRANFSSTPLPNKESYTVHIYDNSSGESVPIPTAHNFRVSVIDYPSFYGVVPRDIVAEQTSYEFTFKGWNLKADDNYTVNLYKDGNPITFSDVTVNWLSSTELKVNLVPTNLLQSGHYNIVIGYANGSSYGASIDVNPVGSPYINIILPTALVAESSDLQASFDVTIETDNIDWSQINLATDVEVWMEGKHIPVMWHATNVTGPDSSDRITATFEGIEVGEYAVIARVRDTFDWVPLFVDSFESKPVINRHANIRPAGYPFFGFNLDGYNLENLSNAVVELYDAANDQVVATTDGSEDWLGAFPSQDGTRLYVEMKAVDVDNGLQAGSYEVRIVDATWDAVVGNRVGPLTILDTPFIQNINPPRLGVGATEYYLYLYGYFLDDLDANNLRVELRGEDDSLFATTTDLDILIRSTFAGRGEIKANFTSIPLTDDMSFYVRVYDQSSGESVLLPMAQIFKVGVTASPVVYEITPREIVAGQTSYEFFVRGWNLEAGDSYNISFMKDGNPVSLTDYTVEWLSSTDLRVIVTPTSFLEAGRYEFDIEYASGSGYGTSITVNPPPTVNRPIVTPDPGYYNLPQEITLTSSTSGAEIFYTTDGTTPSISSTQYTGPITISTSTTIKAVAIKDGLYSEVNNLTFIIDDIDPEINLSGVTDGQVTAEATVVPVFSAADDNLDSVTVTLAKDGGDPAPFDSGSEIIAEGQYVLAITAVDKAGNEAVEVIEFTIDRNAPVIDITGVTDGTYYKESVTPVISVANGGVEAITLMKGTQELSYESGAISEEGEYTLTVTAKNINNLVSDKTISFIIDKTAPAISIDGVTDGQITAEATVVPGFSAADDNLDSVTATLAKDGGDPAPFVSGSEITAEGQYVLTVTAVDKAGNDTVEIINFTIDRNAPVISITGVTDGAYYKESVTPGVSVTNGDVET